MDVMARDDPRTLEQRLQEPQTAASLHRLLDHIDTIEQSLERFAEVTQQTPAFVGMAGDTLDGMARKATEAGVDVNEHLKNALKLAERLTNQHTATQLEQLLNLTEQLPYLTAMLADTVDESVQRANAAGINLHERLHNMSALAEQLSRKETTEQVTSLLELNHQIPGLIAMLADAADNMMRKASAAGVDINERVSTVLDLTEKLTRRQTAQQLSSLLALADEAPGFISMLADILDGYARQAQAEGLDLEKSLTNGLGAVTKLGMTLTPERVQSLEALMMLLDENAVGIASAAGQALQESQQAPKENVTTFGLLRKLGDPDVQRALSFFTTFAKHFGKALK